MPPQNAAEPAEGFLHRRGDVLFGLALLSTVFVLIFPLPGWALDVFLSLSIAISILLTLSIAYVRTPMEFHAFPTILLVVTLFRLGLNVATTRAILVHGDGGHLIRAFGEFVISGNLFVGLIVFGILTLINFVVITKGAGRVAEVSARFTLDAMPGKQMSIDADLNAGLISETDARERRRKLEQESGFYGAMDGASKFVRGDAIAGLLITGINLVGGFAVGVLQQGMSAAESAGHFTLLSVGDGLVSQIPSLLVSVAAGVLVTRSNTPVRLDREVSRQLLGSRKGLTLTGAVLLGMMFIPGFPKVVLGSLGIGFIALGRLRPHAPEIDDDAPAGSTPGAAAAPGATSQAARPGTPDSREPAAPRQEPFAIELGLELLPLAQGSLQGILDRISLLRRNLSQELGLLLPAISLRDNSTLPARQYRFLLRGHEIATGDLMPGQLLAMGVGGLARPLRGRQTIEPAFGLPATWIFEADRREAERLGYAVVDPVSVLLTHLSEVLRREAAELLSRQDAQKLLDGLKDSHGAVLQEMASLQIGVGVVHRVLQNLLREGISIRELPVVLERLCDHFPYSKHPDELSEAARKALAMEITQRCELSEGRLKAVTLHPELEQMLAKSVRQTTHETQLVLDPALARHLHDQLRQAIEAAAREGVGPVVLCAPGVRLALRRFFGDTFPMLRFVAYNEVLSRIPLQSLFSLAPAHSMAAA